MQIIDPHLHLFNLEKGRYAWLRAENPPNWSDKANICRDYVEVDLVVGPELQLAGYVHIEAGFDNNQSWREIDWIEKQASKPVRTIGHIDLTLPPEEFTEALAKLQRRSSVVGIRHIFDDDIERIVANPRTNANLHQLEQANLLFELQIDLKSASTAALSLDLVRSFPELNFVLNHAGFCTIDPAQNTFHSDLEALNTLAKCHNLSIKASGFEMADRHFNTDNAAQFISKLCEQFGERRVMLASNFPLITLGRSYKAYWFEMIEALRKDELPLQHLVYDNAKRIYRFD